MTAALRNLSDLALSPNEIRSEYEAILGDKAIDRNSPNADGWVECWAVDREKGDSPSAAYNVNTGAYTDLGRKHGGGGSLSLVDFMIRHDGCESPRDALTRLALRHRPHLLNGFRKEAESREAERAAKPKPPSSQVVQTAGAIKLIPPTDRREVSALEFVDDLRDLDPGHVGGLLAAKPGMTFEGLRLAGAKWGVYPRGGDGRRGCVVYPARDSAGRINAIVLQRGDGSKFPPANPEGAPRSSIVRKVQTGDSRPAGFIGAHGDSLIRSGKSETVWIVEGVSDLDALQGLIPADLRDSHAVISSACGASEKAGPADYFKLLKGKHVILAGDCDEAGQSGVVRRVAMLHEVGAARIQVIPPWTDVSPKKGQDLRDLIVSGKTFDDILGMAVDAEEPDDEEEEDDGDFHVRSISCREFMDKRFDTTWLVDHVVTEGQPLLIAGASKTLKTSITLDLIVSLGAAREFLNFGRISRVARCGIISVESGEATTQDSIRRICEGKGVDPRDLDFELSFSLPQLTNETHLSRIRRWIEKKRLEVIGLDPCYLMLLDSNTATGAGNVFSMGAALRGVASLGADTGATIVLLHHATKSAARNSVLSGEPIGLEDMSQSGFAEFARQWLLLSRRSRFRDDGNHELWLSYGGSAGHCGLKGLDIREGLTTDIGGRHWSVTARNRSDIEENRATAKNEAKEAKRSAEIEEALEAIRARIRRDGPVVLRDMRSLPGVKRAVAEAAFTQMVDAEELTKTTVKKGNRQQYDAWTLSHWSTGQATGQTGLPDGCGSLGHTQWSAAPLRGADQ